MSNQLFLMSATELVHHYQRKELSPVEVTQTVLEHIDKCNGVLNAFRLVAYDDARRAARESEARWIKGSPRGLLDGVPATIKDDTLTEGWSTLKGSKTVSPAGPWEEDAPIVARMREHGAVLIGKTALPEHGWAFFTESPLTGISRNPWNADKTCGGSSGGAAIAAAAGFGALHCGGDGGGSIRVPAAFCGIYGFKPTFARVPRIHGAAVIGCIGHQGPMTRTVSDAALMMNAICEPDPRDWLALPYDGRDYRIGLEDGIRGLRIGFSPDLGRVDVDPEISRLVAQAVGVLEDLGAIVEEIDPGFEDPRAAIEVLYTTGAGLAMKHLGPDALALMDPRFVEFGEKGNAWSPEDYISAWSARETLGQRMNQFHQTYDLLVTPMLPFAAFDVGEIAPKGSSMTSFFDWLPFSYPFNLTMQPAASVPCGLNGDGLPVAFQIIGPRGSDHLVLRASRAYEAANPFRTPFEKNDG